MCLSAFAREAQQTKTKKSVTQKEMQQYINILMQIIKDKAANGFHWVKILGSHISVNKSVANLL
jgi:hypothetical protein